jgi:aerobic carbon-monoxide dehydrogenase large subunit
VSVLGNRVLRREDARFLRGEGQYVENLPLEGALAVTFVRSLMAHARITVDASAATGLPGVVQVLTGADVDIGPFGPPRLPGLNTAMGRPLVARDRVRFVGEIVAVVVSETRAEGVDAGEHVFVDYDPLPAAVTPEDAARDEVLLFPEAGTNVCARSGSPEHDDALFDGCEVVVSGSVHSRRMAGCPLEPRSAAALRGADGRLTAWLSTQTPHQDHDVIAGTLGLDASRVRVVCPDVGGGFGVKLLSVEELLIAWLATRLDRPVRWTETRSESMVGLGHGRAQQLWFTLGGTRDGRILAYRLEVLQDGGAYPALGSFLPNLTALMASGVYAIPKIEFEGRTVVTNTTPITSFRGAGRPEACQAIERAVDTFATEIGLDPIEVRRRNFIARDSFPHKTASGATYDSGDYEGALDRAVDAAGLDELRGQQARRREAGDAKQLGIGVATYIEITNPAAETEFGEVEFAGDGSVTVRTGSFSHGQGHETTFAQIVAHRLGVPVESVTVLKGDTDEIPKGTGTYGSKSAQLGGTAAQLAADDVIVKARELAAEYLEVSVEDVRLDVVAGRLELAGAPQRGFSWQELAAHAADEGKLDQLTAAHEFHGVPTFPFGCHIAVVEVDTETGRVELVRFVAVDDAGTIINPIVFEGQVHGGIATGVSQALYEQYLFDEHGTPITSTFSDYAFPAAADLPSWETVEMQTPTPINPLGAKGIGESGTMGSTPAVQSAVIDALAPLGVRNVDLPVNGENVWRAIEAATA